MPCPAWESIPHDNGLVVVNQPSSLAHRRRSTLTVNFRSDAARGPCTGLTGYVGRAEPRVASQHAMLFDVAVGSSTEQLQQMRRSAFTNSIYLGAREDGGPQWGMERTRSRGRAHITARAVLARGER